MQKKVAYDHLIIDFDGTLFDSHKAVQESMLNTLKYFSYNPNKEHINLLIQKGLSLSDMLFQLTSNSDLKEMSHYYLEIHKKDIITHGKWYPHALTFLDKISDLYHVWIVSNRQQVTLDAVCDHYQIKSPDRILGSKPQQPIKPTKEPFYSMLDQSLASSSIRRLVIGDTHIDLQFAKELHCDAGWVDHGYGEYDQTWHPIQFKWKNLYEASEDLI